MQSFYKKIEDNLYLINEELDQYENITDTMINICLIALINAIKSNVNDIKTYLHLSLLVNLEAKIMIEKIDFDISLVRMNLYISKEELNNYVNIIKNKPNTLKLK